jgi:hypothetical protein
VTPEKSERVAIIGSRTWPDPAAVREYVRQLPRGTVVVTGAWDDGKKIYPTPGVDAMAYAAAIECGLVPALVVANPHAHGWKAAGPHRNPITVEIADRVVAFDAGTPGTAHTIGLAERAGKPCERRKA